MQFSRRKMLAAGAGVAATAATGGVASASVDHSVSDTALARSLGFTSAHADVNGTSLHYVTGGQGAPLVLLPGWPETWWQFRKIMPALARRYRVIAVDLRGMGGSAKPAGGYDKKTMARDIFELTRRLGHTQVNIAGHDIGAMVAHSFAINHSDATTKVALLDVAHPDESLYQLPLLPKPGEFHLWWFAFNQVRALPEQLITGRSRFLIDYFCDLLLVNPAAISDATRAIYAQAYAKPDAIRAGNAWYQAFNQDIEDQKTYPKVTKPLLGLAAEASFEFFQYVLSTKGTDVRVSKVERSGHFLAEEQPDTVIRALTEFFA
ncbi:Pimeloyl-ACP methyl ester carboxylesterase [Amycolatopsis xylanica]|uniref:Pimeloyl-ACP methyl ester carboxylesterase n=1 Tax=Amycolatopsis xylanica TaxID=589385 RepID=A0A1H3HBD7_9PSEU|nr:alpha/beta hydrolase [Amycolatopsis xylanica]SDY12670.1 Pimeloyl-ACP methyl ester carboxylesterase [Amycolatopsis xylanica]